MVYCRVQSLGFRVWDCVGVQDSGLKAKTNQMTKLWNALGESEDSICCKYAHQYLLHHLDSARMIPFTYTKG